MKYFLVFCILITVLPESFSQNQTDSLEMEVAIGTIFRQNDMILSPRDVLCVMQLNEQAYDEMSLAISVRNSGFALGCIGGLAFVFSMGRLIIGAEPSWVLTGLGAAGIAASFGLKSAYYKHARNAISTYNSGLKPLSNRNTELNLVLSNNGIGVCFKF